MCSDTIIFWIVRVCLKMKTNTHEACYQEREKKRGLCVLWDDTKMIHACTCLCDEIITTHMHVQQG